MRDSKTLISYICKAKRVLNIARIALVLLFVVYFAASVRYLEGLRYALPLPSEWTLMQGNNIDVSLKLQSRADVQTSTAWGAPIVWEGMFDPDLYDRVHRRKTSSVALTVFAVGRYLDAYLENFLLSAERHFMVDLPVTYYVFTDAPSKVPVVRLAAGRAVTVLRLQKHSRWQDVSMMRMRAIRDAIDSRIRNGSSHVFCFDVDQVFAGRFGSEALGESVALLHAHYYRLPRGRFTYDRDPRSSAYMKAGDGDFYYHAAVFGGTWRSVRRLADSCHRSIMADKQAGVEARWHDESHLNKYLWLAKPSKVLSPEYCWDESIGYRGDIRLARLLWAEKRYDSLRETEEGVRGPVSLEMHLAP